MGTCLLSIRRNLLLLLLLVGASFACFSLITPPVSAATGINQQMNFQGRLLNAAGATVADGYYNIQFKLYQDGDGQSVGNTTGSPAGTLLWTESHLNASSQGVTVKNGYMSVQLGSITAFGTSVDWNQDTLWLSMNIGNTNLSCTPFSSCSPDGEMTPMKRLSTVPYAFNSAKLGGLSSANFLQLAQGLQTDASNTTSIAINKTGTGNIVNLQKSAVDVFAITNTGEISFGGNANHSISVAAAASGAGKTLTVVSGAAASGSTLAGGNLILQGGAGDGAAASGSVIVKSNTTNSTTAFQVENSSGVSLLNVDTTNKAVSLGSGITLPVPNITSYTTPTTGGSINNGTTYYYGVTAVNGATETEISPIETVAIVSGTNTNRVVLNWTQSTGATGYKVYRNTSNSFTSGSLLLTTIGSGGTVTYSDTGTSTGAGLPPTAYVPTLIKTDAAATDPFGTGQSSYLGSIYYNTTSGEFQCYKDSGVGGLWADCGVTTLQGAYNNGDDTATVPAIKLDAEHGTINIQDADTTLGVDLLDVRTGNGGGLGSVLFGIGNTGTVTVQNASNQNTSFRILNAGGTYMVNANSSSNYLISNTTKTIKNDLQNPSFEAGGVITSGEEGWNGPSQASIVNSSANAKNGNYELQVTPNGTTLKTYGGTYYEVNEGDVIYFEGWVKNSGGANGTGGVILESFDKDKGAISSASDSGSLPGTSYVLRKVSYTVPSTVKYIRVAAVVNSGASTGTYYFDEFHLSSSSRSPQLFQNTANSTTAFMIQSASAAQTLFTANTTDNVLKVGDATGTDTDTTIFVVDSATADPTTSLASKNGGLFYRSDSSSLKAIIGGAVVDVCTTAVTCSGYSASAGSVVQLQATTPGTAQTGNFNITGTGILTQLQTQDKSTSSTNSSALTIRTGNATGTTSNSGSLTIDVGTATGTLGTITLGHTGVATTIPGAVTIQSGTSLTLGVASTNRGAIVFHNSVGGNAVTLQAPGSNPASAFSITLPTDAGSSGDCLKSTGSGVLGFSACGSSPTVNLQNVYANSSPATLTLADAKDISFVAAETTTDPSVIFNLQCTTCSSNGGRFAVQNGGTDVLTIKPNSGGVIINSYTQIGSSTTDATQVNFQLDSYNGSSDSGTCTTTTNQGAMYYNSTMGALRSCLNGSWVDVSNPDTLGLLTFGIVPSTGSNPYDLPALVVAGVSGPCKVSWASNTSVAIEACVAYSSGRRVNVTATTLNTNSAVAPNTNLTTTNRWGHICLSGTNNQPAFTNTAGQNTALTAMPTFNTSSPILCLADVQGESVTAGKIDNIYDVRSFTSTVKEAVNMATAAEMGMLVDASSSGGLVPAAVCTTGTCSGKLYGSVIVTDGSTSAGAPNAIVASVGPAYVKATAGTAGDFIKSGPTSGYGATVTAIPNNAFYYSPGNTRTTWSTTCTSAANCLGSLYVNFIVR